MEWNQPPRSGTGGTGGHAAKKQNIKTKTVQKQTQTSTNTHTHKRFFRTAVPKRATHRQQHLDRRTAGYWEVWQGETSFKASALDVQASHCTGEPRERELKLYEQGPARGRRRPSGAGQKQDRPKKTDTRRTTTDTRDNRRADPAGKQKKDPETQKGTHMLLSPRKYVQIMSFPCGRLIPFTSCIVATWNNTARRKKSTIKCRYSSRKRITAK